MERKPCLLPERTLLLALLTACCLAGFPSVHAQDSTGESATPPTSGQHGPATPLRNRSPASTKKIFWAPYPRPLSFRTAQRGWGAISKAGADRSRLEDVYERWQAKLQDSDVVTLKFLREEISEPAFDTLAEFADRFAADNPEKLVMLHWNARARDPAWRREHFFPGHWLHYPGTTLATSLDSTGRTISVEDASLFRLDVGLRNRTANQKRRRVNDVIALVPIDSRGNRLWAEAEHVDLLDIDTVRGTLDVARGRYGTEARSFRTGRTWVAPIVTTGPWYIDALWAYNYSLDGPRDADGRSTVDVLVDEFRGMRQAGGELRNIGGVTFDLLYHDAIFKSGGRLPDIDNDGASDSGYVAGRNVYALGVHAYLRRLRDIAGSGFVMTGDAQLVASQRAVHLLDGMESEGLGFPADGYRAWSKALNLLRYWGKAGDENRRFNYVVPKTGENDAFPVDDMRSLAHGTFTAMAGYIAIYRDDTWASLDEDGLRRHETPPTLGWPLSPAELLSDRQPTFLDDVGATTLGAESSDSRLDGVRAIGGSLSMDGTALRLSPQPAPPRASAPPDASIVLEGLRVESADLLLEFDTLGTSAMAGFDDSVPQIVEVRVHGARHREHLPRELFGYYDTRNETPGTYYLSGIGPAVIDVEIRFPHVENDVTVTNLTARDAVPILVRDFDHGSLIVNPSVRPVRVATVERLVTGGTSVVLGARLASCRERFPVGFDTFEIAPVSSIVVASCDPDGQG